MHAPSTQTILRTSLALALLLAAGYRANGQEKSITSDDLARKAEVVAVARVAQMKSEWNESHSMIRTRVTIAVNEYLKGSTAATVLTVYVPGGEVGDVGELYTHVPSFRENENVVVFLEKGQDGTYRVSGGTQGKYIIETDRATGQATVAGKTNLEEFKKSIKNAVQQ
jgi:hypothetical protein